MLANQEAMGRDGRPGPPEGNALPPATVLLVDDQPLFLVMGRSILGAAGYAVRTAASGAEALDMVRAAPPDAILLDVQMPEMDGFETLRRLKANPATAAIPVAMLTATQDPQLNRKAFQAGAEGVVLKTIGAERLLNLLRVVLTTGRSAGAAGTLEPGVAAR